MLSETNERKWSIYLHTVPKEITRYPHDKYYVGLVKGNPDNRWRNGEGYRTQFFYRAIQKYGWDNIQHSILLEGLTRDEAREYEKMYIAFYNSNDNFYGYNISKGGDDHTELGEPIAQYTLKGDFVRTYNGIAEAAEKNGWSRLLMAGRISHGYQWRYLREYETLPEKISAIKLYDWSKEVEQYDLFGNYIRSYESVRDTTRQLGSVFLKLRHDRTIVSGGYQYKYAEDQFAVENVYSRDNVAIPIYCYSLDGDFLKEYKSRKEALRDLGIYNGYKAFEYESFNVPFFVFYNPYNNAYKGYRWSFIYYDKLPPLIEVHYKEHPVIQLDKDFNLINIYPHASYAVNCLNKGYENSHNNMISRACKRNESYFTKQQKPTIAYKYIWFRFIDIDRLKIKISDLDLLHKYYIYDRIVNDLERRNEKKCQQ